MYVNVDASPFGRPASDHVDTIATSLARMNSGGKGGRRVHRRAVDGSRRKSHGTDPMSLRAESNGHD